MTTGRPMTRRQLKLWRARVMQPIAELERKAAKAKRRCCWTAEDIDLGERRGFELYNKLQGTWS